MLGINLRSSLLIAVAKALPEGQTIPDEWLRAYWESTRLFLLAFSKSQMIQMAIGINMLHKRSLVAMGPSQEWIQSYVDRLDILRGMGLSVWEIHVISKSIRNAIRAQKKEKR